MMTEFFNEHGLECLTGPTTSREEIGKKANRERAKRGTHKCELEKIRVTTDGSG